MFKHPRFRPSTGNMTEDVFPASETSVFQDEAGDWYAPVLLGPSTIGAYATDSSCLRSVVEVLNRLEQDEYVRYLIAYYGAGLERFGGHWRYADITTVLLAAARLARPKSYLEIGVRQGRSMAMVAATCPESDIVGFDIWAGDYAGMPNPGPDFVRSVLESVGHRGDVELVAGNSHETVPAYFRDHPEAYFDLITVDGDHSRRGAAQDLKDVLPRLKVGGVLVFDDIVHPAHHYLGHVWNRVIGSDPTMACWEFRELGYGVALAIRKA